MFIMLLILMLAFEAINILLTLHDISKNDNLIKDIKELQAFLYKCKLQEQDINYEVHHDT